MAACERLIVPIAVLLLQLTGAYTDAAEPHLEILPSGETQSKPIGSSIILTCKPKVEQPELISNMEWLDTNNRTIEPLNLLVLPLKSSHVGMQKPTMYTERYPDGSLALFFNSLDAEQAGKYYCTGTYANSMLMSKSITIVTIIAITWENAPLDQHPVIGEEFPIHCKVRANPPPSVDWLYNGELIRTNDHYIIDKFTLTIKNVQESDDGIYTCRASVQTTGELRERPIKVEVYTRPSIEEIPSPIEIIEGENAYITCKATGKPPPLMSWVKSLTHTNLSTVDRFSVDPYTGVLSITDVKREDEGEYQCEAKSPAGIATTDIQVNVIVKPKIMQFNNETVKDQQNMVLTCKAFGRPSPVVSFRKHTIEKPYLMGPQPNDDRIMVSNSPDKVTGETIGTLMFSKVLRTDDGLYECIAKNPGGAVYRNGHITVEYAPSFRLMPNVTVWSWDKRPVNLTCIAESIPNATIRWTIYGDQAVENHAMLQQIGNGPVSILVVTPSDSRYYTQYKCIATNIHGTSNIFIELREATRPANLLDVKMIDISATTIAFKLTLPNSDLQIKTVTVQYKERNDIWTQARNKTWSVGGRYVIEDLKPLTWYDFRFAVMSDVGLGNWGNDYHETTPGKTVPKEPKVLKVSEESRDYDASKFNNQYELGWITPVDNGEPIDMYRVKYCQLRPNGEVLYDTCETEDIKSQNRHWLRHLKSNTLYNVELQAHNAMGFGEPGYGRFKTSRETTSYTVDYTVISAAGGTCNNVVAAITTAILLLSLSI